MRLILTFCFVLINIIFLSTAKKLKDEDFSEFDNFDDDEFVDESSLPFDTANPSNKIESIKAESSSSSATANKKIDDITDDDDETMFDDEEFENLDTINSSPSLSSTSDLKITEVPSNLTGNRWEAYYCEGIMIIILLGYLINFLLGRTKNARLASAIYHSQSDLLEKNFSLIGDNGQTRTIENNDEQTNNNDSLTTNLRKESENLYILWCTGRVAIENMLIEIRFIKRQCLFNSLASLIKSINDTIVYTIDFSKDDMETFVFCLAKKRSAIRLHRDMNDLSQFCTERKNADKRGLVSGNYQILSEFGEVSSVIVDNRLVDFIDKYPDVLEYIHITDQYTGSKNPTENLQSNTNTISQQQDALNTSERSVRRVLIIAFNLLAQNDRSLQITSEYIVNDYLRLVLYLIDRISMYRFQSKELKLKAMKNRQRIEEQFLKNVYQQRQEQAQQRREEKRRAEKEKIMQLDDPERQRKWEEKEHKRELKRRQPKMKQMKIKSI